jgi:hypothetical protein
VSKEVKEVSKEVKYQGQHNRKVFSQGLNALGNKFTDLAIDHPSTY